MTVRPRSLDRKMISCSVVENLENVNFLNIF